MASSSHKAKILFYSTEYSAYASTATATATTAMLDSTVLADTAKRSTAGLTEGSFSFEGFDTAAALGHLAGTIDILELTGAVPVPFTYAPLGLTVGNPCFVIPTRRASFEMGSEVNGMSNFSFTAQPDVFGAQGVILHGLTAETADGNGTSYDRQVTSTSNGAVACLHTTAFSGLTNNVVTIEDSANDSVWSTIGTFTTVTGAGGYVLFIAGTVRRYVRAVTNVTGTGSTTFAVSFAAH